MSLTPSVLLSTVSLTAAKTSRTLDVSMVCMKLSQMVSFRPEAPAKKPYWGYTLRFVAFTCRNRNNTNLAAAFTFGPPVYSWKYRSSGTLKPNRLVYWEKGREWRRLLTFLSLSRKVSSLVRNRMIDVLRNHLELTTESKRTRDSAILF